MNAVTTARGRALAAQDHSIANNIAKIEEAKQRPTAIQAMAMRLNMTPGKLQETLRQTVFRDANDAEFAALVVVANEYKLNPLLKEIYGFKAKGGGIIPYVSVDGWVRIINEHPMFDGVEFNDIADEKGTIYAIESVIYRKDRSRPVKVTEYLDECRRKSDPWDNSPNRMLRHRALIQGARYAFGFAGITAEGDYEVQTIGDPVDARNVTLPTRRETIAHDPDTGEVLSDEELAALDRESFAQMERRAETDMGEAHSESDAACQLADTLIKGLRAATGKIDRIGEIMAANGEHVDAMPEAIRDEVYAARDKAMGR